MRKQIVLLSALVVFGFAGCQKKAENKATGGHESGHMHPGGESQTNPAKGKVEVPAKGKAYKPPLTKAQVPPNVWICDMGTVHYARGEKGDGICPLCKMKLKHWKPAGM